MNRKTERLDVLVEGKYVIWQAQDVLCYTMDSVLLANFLHLRKDSQVLELGAGTGAISMLLAIRGAKGVLGVDINPRLVELFARSICENNLQDLVRVQQVDITNTKQLAGLGAFDVVVANPPYRKQDSGQPRSGINAGMACHELAATLEDFIIAGSRILKTGGRLALVNLAERLTDTMELMRKYKLEPKRLQFVHSKIDTPAKIFLIEGVCGGQIGGLNIMPALAVYDQYGEYTPELKQYYRSVKTF